MTAMIWNATSITGTYDMSQSFDGQYAVAASFDIVPTGAITYSNDYGASWTDVTPTPIGDETGTLEFVFSVISHDGTKIACAAQTTPGADVWIWVSDDSGATWNRGPLIDMSGNYPNVVVMNGSGQYIFTSAASTGEVWMSDDGGASYTALSDGVEIYLPPDTGISTLTTSFSGDGVVQAFITDAQELYLSTDSGGTWSNPVATPSGLNSVCVVSDGDIIFVGTATGEVHMSTDNGGSWSLLTVTSVPAYVSASGEGARLLVMNGSGDVFTSGDGGVTFGEQTTFTGIAVLSGDGQRVLGHDASGTIYRALYQDPETGEPPVDPGDPDGGATSPVTPADGSVQSNPGESVVFNTKTIVPPLVFGQYAVAWSEPLGLFVGSVGNKIYTSPDGENWTLRYTALTGGTGGPAAWGNGTFVVTGPEGALFTSTNGVAWTKQTSVNFGTAYPYLGENAEFLTLAYGDDKFVATFVLFGAIVVRSSMFSTSGIAWTQSPTGFGMDSNTPVTYSPVRELFVATDGDKVFRSGDGVSWGGDVIASASGLSNVVWAVDKFVAIDELGYVYTSVDSVDWTRAASAMGIGGRVSLVMVGTTIVGISEGRVFTSTDGQVWFKYNVAEVSGSALLVTDNRRGYAYSAASLTIIYLSGGASMQLPMFELMATGYDDAEGPIGIGRAKLTLDDFLLEAHGYEDSNARLTLPMFKMIGYGKPLSGFAKLTLPMFELEASGRRAATSSLIKNLPKFTGVGYGGAQYRGDLPMFQLEAEGTVTVVGRARLKLPMLTIMAGGEVAGMGQARLEFQDTFTMQAYGGAQARLVFQDGFTLLATGSGGSAGQARLKLPVFTIVAEGAPAPTGSAELTLPMLRMVPSAVARLVLPGFRLLATGHAEVDIEYEAYAANLLQPVDTPPGNTFEAKVSEITHYTNYPFKQIVAFNGEYYGVAADGLHLLGGDTDAGEPIAWKFRTALSDMKSKKLKRLVSVYTGGRVIEGMEVTLVVGEAQDLTYTYTTPRGVDAQNYRTMFGKGVRTRWAALEYSDPLGKAIMIDSIDMETEILERAI